MKNVKKFRTGLLSVSLIMILVVFGIAFRDKKKKIVLESEGLNGFSSNASIELKNVTYNTTNINNFKEWELKAESARYFKEQNLVVLKNAEIVLYRLDGKVYHITGKHGEFDTDTRNIKMKGDVRGILPDKTAIMTETFFYDHKKREITTEEKVLIKRGEFSMEGLGLVIDLNKEKLFILHKVKAQGNK